MKYYFTIMFNAILLTLSLNAFSLNALATDIIETISLSEKGFDFSVALFDEPKTMGWSTAKRACDDKNMRLPTLEEWGQIHCHSDLNNSKDHFRYPETDKACEKSKTSSTVPNLKPGSFYWSSTTFNMGVAQYSDTFDGHQGYKEKKEKLFVRCIK